MTSYCCTAPDDDKFHEHCGLFAKNKKQLTDASSSSSRVVAAAAAAAAVAVTVVVGETKEEMNINDYRDDIIHCTATEADKFVKQRRYRYHIAK